jgi:dTMP kinase
MVIMGPPGRTMRVIGNDKFNGSPAHDTGLVASGSLMNIMLQNEGDEPLRFDPKMISTGCLIVLDGIDGCGKTTLAEYLAKTISDTLGERVILTQEPSYAFWWSQLLESLCKEHSEAQAIRFILDHAVHLKDVIIPALMLNRIVICDRWTPYSSTIYQGPEYTKELVYGASVNQDGWSLEPDLSLIMIANMEKIKERIQKRGKSQLSEYEQISFLEQAQSRYLNLLEDRRGHGFHRVDGNLNMEFLGPGIFSLCMKVINNKRGIRW